MKYLKNNNFFKIPRLIIFLSLLFLLSESKSQNLKEVPVSYVESQYVISDSLPFSLKDTAFFIAKDSAALFYLEENTELIISVRDVDNWKTWRWQGTIDYVSNVKLIDFNNDSVPELVFQYGFQEGISWGGIESNTLEIWDYRNMICLFSEEVHMFGFSNVWNDSLQERVYEESLSEIEFSLNQDTLIIKNIINNETTAFRVGKYLLNKENWIKLE